MSKSLLASSDVSSSFVNSQAKGLFNDLDEYLEFLEEFDLTDARLAVLQSHGRFDQAAELQIQLGREFEAIDLFLKSENPESRGRAATSVLNGLWKRFFMGHVPHAQDETVSKFLTLGDSALNENPLVSQDFTSPASCNPPELHVPEQMSMFRLLPNGNPPDLASLGRRLRNLNEKSGALLCFDRALRAPPALHDMTVDGLFVVLDYYLDYGDLLEGLTKTSTLADKATVQKALHFSPVVDTAETIESSSVHQYLIDRSSVLFARANQRRVGQLDSDGNVIAPPVEVDIVIRRSLGDRYNQTLARVHEAALTAPALQPCAEHAMTGICARRSCARKDHTVNADGGNVLFSKRVRAIAKLILIMDKVYAEPGMGQGAHRREVLQRYV